MNGNTQTLAERLRDKEARIAVSDEHLNRYLATQLLAVREDRGLTQSALAAATNTTQSAISRMESVSYGNWTVKRLKAMAYALGCRLKVSLETFGSILDEAARMDRATLTRVDAEEDPIIFPERAALRRTMATPQPFLGRNPEPVAEPIRWMQQRLLPWLDRSAPDGDLAQLKTWLAGRDLPPVGDDFKPYELIYEAIPLDEFGDGHYFQTLAKRTALLLQEQVTDPRQSLSEPWLPKNLFRLAAQLREPKIFAEPLLSIYEALKTGTVEMELSARAGLLAGMVWNQPDDSLVADWFTMGVHGSSILPGNYLDAICGLRLAPSKDGKPNYLALAKAVKVQEIHENRKTPGVADKTLALFTDLKERELKADDRHAIEVGVTGVSEAGWAFGTAKRLFTLIPRERIESAIADPLIDRGKRHLLHSVTFDLLGLEIAKRNGITSDLVTTPGFKLPDPVRRQRMEIDRPLMRGQDVGFLGERIAA